MTARPRILDLSFSTLTLDARVLRQLSIVTEFGHITTCGYGLATPFSDDHIRIPDGQPSLPQTLAGVTNLVLHRHHAADLQAPGARAVLGELLSRRFDLVVANDARALPLAAAVARDAPIWVDLHEWAPEERTHVTSWRLLVSPWIDHVCREYLPKTAAQTTVGRRIAQLYERHYGVAPQVMRNAAAYADLVPSPVSEDGPLCLVHSGAAVPGRSIESMMTAVLEAGDDFALDLFLLPGGDSGRYLARLKSLAAGIDQITFNDPVKPSELPLALNPYDVGAFWIPPFNTNARLTLPNKLFDFIQARLGVAVGPSVEMADIVKEFGLGTVSKSFEIPAIKDSLQSLTKQAVREYKQAAHAAAQPLSFEAESEVARGILAQLLP